MKRGEIIDDMAAHGAVLCGIEWWDDHVVEAAWQKWHAAGQPTGAVLVETGGDRGAFRVTINEAPPLLE